MYFTKFSVLTHVYLQQCILMFMIIFYEKVFFIQDKYIWFYVSMSTIMWSRGVVGKPAGTVPLEYNVSV